MLNKPLFKSGAESPYAINKRESSPIRAGNESLQNGNSASMRRSTIKGIARQESEQLDGSNNNKNNLSKA